MLGEPLGGLLQAAGVSGEDELGRGCALEGVADCHLPLAGTSGRVFQIDPNKVLCPLKTKTRKVSPLTSTMKNVFQVEIIAPV